MGFSAVKDPQWVRSSVGKCSR